MADQVYMRDSTVRGEHPSAGVGRYSAYDQSSERFLCANVEAGDFSATGLETRLTGLTPGSGTALWIMPFRGISPTSVRVPIDLIYLDRNCVVLETVESFPLAVASPSCAPAASVLALPANTIESAGTHRGHQLMLCAPEEMKRRVQQLLTSRAEMRAEASAGSGQDSPARSTSGKLLVLVDRSRPKPAGNELPVEVPPVETPNVPGLKPAPEPELAKPEQKPAKPAKSWLQKLLSPDPPQPRKAEREALEGLSAFFFTGGESVAHGVRDISLTGFYVFTAERWYPGTVIRMTLTDRHQPTAERSMTVNASVMRWGNDGVGLKFIFADGKDAGTAMNGMMGGASKAQVAQFIERLRGGK